LNGRETAVGVFVAGVKTHKANGATRFIPGSHLWGNERQPKEEECVYAELEAGDAFFMLASCYHGGSANTTKDEWRLVYGTFCTRGCM
jgi:ectoine hydroxylase-related dioxygenase (phytanoyl-CoA dioxygenase family)